MSEPQGYYAFIAASYDVWSFQVDRQSIAFNANVRMGSLLYGRGVIPDSATGLLRLCRDGEQPFGYLGDVMADGWAECVARKPFLLPR